MRGEDTRASLHAAVEAKDLLRFRTVGDVALSADGSRVAFTLSEIDTTIDGYVTSVWAADAGAGEPKRLTTPDKKKASAPRFSPDGKLIAFLSDRERDKPQLYVMPATGGEARRLTDLALGAMPATWSPDG